MRACVLSIQKQNPVNSNIMLIRGNVVSKRNLRPNLSIKKTAGKAKTKLHAPNPTEAARAWMLLKPD